MDDRHQPLAALDDARAAATAALTDNPARPMDAVAWMAAHVTAMQRTVLPRAVNPAERAAARQVRRRSRDLQGALRRLEMRYSGDALVAAMDGDLLQQAALEMMDEHQAAERRLLQLLCGRLGAEATDVAAAYRRALEVAPTRPHPHAPGRGPFGTLAFRLEGWWDRVLNTMDARHVPTPRRDRPSVVAGKWTGYLLGGMPASNARQRSTAQDR
jgi:hypothetical protein